MKLTSHVCHHGVDKQQLPLLLSVLLFHVRESLQTCHFPTIFFLVDFCVHCPFTQCVLLVLPLWPLVWLTLTYMKRTYFGVPYCAFFLQPSVTSPGIQIFSSIICSSLNIRDQVSHPYKGTVRTCELTSQPGEKYHFFFLQNVLREITLQRCLRNVGAPKMFV